MKLVISKAVKAMACEGDNVVLNGTVEVDGAYLGGYEKSANRKSDRLSRRLRVN